MKLKNLLAVFFVSLIYLFSAGPALAIEIDFGTLDTIRQNYCNDRTGDVINLQTWYSGKCTGNKLGADPESIGFSDIVLLDFLTLLMGEPEPGGQVMSESGQPISQGGILDIGAGAVGTMYQKPIASSVEYIAYVRGNLAKRSIVQPAYAQGPGYGFQALSPILPLWRAFRNVTYALFALVFVAYGFMIMFRFKISAQAAVTIQTALPKIIVTLLLITFSYAIVGFLMDMMYVLLGLFMAALRQEELISGRIQSSWGAGGVSLPEVFFRVFAHFIGGLPAKMLGVVFSIPSALTQALNTVLTVAGAVGFATALTNPIGIATLILIAIVIVLFFAYIWFKIFLALLDAAIKIILQTIFAPFILLTGILPGSNVFKTWVVGIASNLSVFFGVIIMLTFALIFMGDYYFLFVNITDAANSVCTGTLGTCFVNDFNFPETSGTLQFPLLGGTSAENVLGLIGFGFFIMTPKVADIMKEAIKGNFGAAGLGSALQDPLMFGVGGATGQGWQGRLGARVFGGRAEQPSRLAQSGIGTAYQQQAQGVREAVYGKQKEEGS